jgi:nicotinamide phosphoribosyltransferase
MQKLNSQILMSADSYKLTHVDQIIEGTTHIYETFTPRSLKHLPKEVKELTNNKIIWFGFQSTIKMIHDKFQEEFFSKNYDEAVHYFLSQVGFFTGGSYDDSHIYELHKLGYLPIKVKSLEEGSLVNVKIPCMTIINTVPGYAWLVGYLETILSNETWKSTTNATIAFAYRKLFTKAAMETVGNDEFVKWQGHDFSARGMSGSADASKQGMSHLTSFFGSDAFGSMLPISYYYNESINNFIAGSIRASEHMTETLAIQVLAKKHNVDLDEAEYMQMKRLITEVYPTGIVARVCDSYDYWNVVTNIIPRLKEDIMNRGQDSKGFSKVVIRPDSGEPVDIICGTAIPVFTLTDVERWFKENKHKESQIFVKIDGNNVAHYMNCEVTENGIVTNEIPSNKVTAEMKGTVSCLWEIFGGTITEKGYKLLDNHIGMIYGDSITIKRAEEIVFRLKMKGFASINTLLGIGSYTYQMVSRDTLGMALKATFAIVDGQEIDLNKNPKTDDGTKKSAKGRVRVEKNNSEYVLFDQQSEQEEAGGLLRIVYCDGKFLNQQTFSDIRTIIDSNVLL